MRRFVPMLVTILFVVAILGAAQSAHADTIHPAMATQAGKTGTLSFDVVNETAAAHSYDVTATGLPKGAVASIVTDGPVITAVDVGANSRAALVLRVDVPAEMHPGRFTAKIVMRRDDGVTITMPFTLGVDDHFALTMTSTTRNVTTFSGQSFTFDFTVLNSGVAPVTNVTPQLDMPAKWVPVADPLLVTSLAPGKEATFHVTVTVPASQVAIRQSVGLSIVSDQITSPTNAVDVQVQSNPAYLPAAIAVAILSVIGVLIYFKRMGRR